MTLADRHTIRDVRVRLPGMGLGRVVALLGCIVVWFGLSQSFYRLTLPAGFTNNLLGGLQGTDPVRAAIAHLLGPVTLRAERPGGVGVDAWTAFDTLDVAIAAGAAVCAALVILGAVRLVSQTLLQVVWMAGLAGCGVVIWRMIDRPLPMDILALDRGAWMLLVGCGLVAVGGWLVAARN